MRELATYELGDMTVTYSIDPRSLSAPGSATSPTLLPNPAPATRPHG
jgi:hypothetical protein